MPVGADDSGDEVTMLAAPPESGEDRHRGEPLELLALDRGRPSVANDQRGDRECPAGQDQDRRDHVVEEGH